MKKRNIRKLIQTVVLPYTVLVALAICTSNESIAQSQLACELTKMDVVYVGVDNPVIIAASDYSVNDLEVAITNGQINGLAGKYIIRPEKPGKVELTIKADGKMLGTRTLRALPTPDPQAGIIIKDNEKKKFIGNGTVSIAQLTQIENIHAEIKDFLFDVEYEVVEFQVAVSGKNGINIVMTSNSNRITDEQKNLLKQLKSGQKVYFENIKVVGPDGLTRTLNDVVLKVL